MIFCQEQDSFAFCGDELRRLLVPSVIQNKSVRAGSNLLRYGLAVHEFGDLFSVEVNLDFPLLCVLGGVAVDGERSRHGDSQSLHGGARARQMIRNSRRRSCPVIMRWRFGGQCLKRDSVIKIITKERK